MKITNLFEWSRSDCLVKINSLHMQNDYKINTRKKTMKSGFHYQSYF